jgi:predicted ester cyclase
MVADDDKIAIAYTITGTHKGNFLGIPATGKKITARGMQIARFNNDAKIVERWGSSDQRRNSATDRLSEGRPIDDSSDGSHR